MDSSTSHFWTGPIAKNNLFLRKKTIVFCSLAATVLTEKIIKSNGGIELRSVVKFCVALNKSLTETLRLIKSMGKYAVQVLFINGTRVLGAGETN